MLERASSPAYRALSPCGRKVLAPIEGEVQRCGGVAAVRCSTIEWLTNVPHSTCGFAQRQIRLLGFVSVELVYDGPRPINSFKLSSRWQSIGTDEARRLAAQARGRVGLARPPVAAAPGPLVLVD